MQLRRMVNASNSDKSLTVSMTGILEVNIIASSLLNASTVTQNRSPTAREVKTETAVANFAPLALPAPSSFATRTLEQVGDIHLDFLNWRNCP